MKNLIIILLFVVGVNLSGGAQDLHYSQFYNAPLVINPALTGLFSGDQRITVSFRDQGRSLPVPYLTFTAGYDQKIYLPKTNNSFLGFGGYFNYDKQGDSKLRLINLNLTASYSRIINDKNIVTFGGQIGYANRGFDPTTLTWDSQWNSLTNEFNSSLPSGETFAFESFSFLETALGFNYRWQKSDRTKIDIGMGAHHLTEPNSRFNNNVSETLPIRLSIYGIYVRELSEKLDLQVDLMHQRQEKYKEFLVGGYLNFYLNQTKGNQRQFRAGGGYKTNGKVMFLKAGVQLNELFFALSYDIDLSGISTDHPGGSGYAPELHFRYIIKHVKPLGNFKTCPIL